MRHRIRVGEVEVATSLPLTYKQLRNLLGMASLVAERVAAEPEQAASAFQIGFTSELAADYHDPRTEPDYSEDAP